MVAPSGGRGRLVGKKRIGEIGGEEEGGSCVGKGRDKRGIGTSLRMYVCMCVYEGARDVALNVALNVAWEASDTARKSFVTTELERKKNKWRIKFLGHRRGRRK